MTDFLSSSAVWGIVLTLCAFGVGRLVQRLPGLRWLNPLLTGSLLTIFVLSLLAIPYPAYKASASPLTYLLMPATVSLAIPLHEAWAKLQNRLPAILSGIGAGAVTGVAASFFLARLFSLPLPYAVSFLPKSVTTAIGMDVAAELGGAVPLAIVLIVLTGISGNLLAQVFGKLFRVTHPIAVGAAIGTCSHAIGTSKALELGETEGAVSSLAIAVAGILTAILCPLFLSGLT